MKKIAWLFMSVLLIVALVACSSAPANEEEMKSETTEEMTEVVEMPVDSDMSEGGDMDTAEEMSEDGDMNDEMMSEDGMLELTLEELKQYNGQDGQPAYVAVDGVIYDFSDVAAWMGGKHHGNMAGNDLTDIIKNKSPHGLKVLDGKTVVGKLVE
jgi:predicted heme/steroid binding protein